MIDRPSEVPTAHSLPVHFWTFQGYCLCRYLPVNVFKGSGVLYVIDVSRNLKFEPEKSDELKRRNR